MRCRTSVQSKILNKPGIRRDSLRFNAELFAGQLPHFFENGIERLRSFKVLKLSFDRLDELTHRVDFLGDGVRNLDAELLFDGHHQLDRV